MGKIAREQNVNDETIRKWLIKHKIRRRTLSESRTGPLNGMHGKKHTKRTIKLIAASAKKRVGKKAGRWNGGKILRVCQVCGISFSVSPSVVKRGYGNYCSHSCRQMYNIKHQRKKGTDIEQMIERWLKDNNIRYHSQWPIRLDDFSTSVDFFIEPNICIFCDGDYWHSLPETIERDNKTNRALMERNYRIERLQGSEIRNGVRPLGIIKMAHKRIDTAQIRLEEFV